MLGRFLCIAVFALAACDAGGGGSAGLDVAPGPDESGRHDPGDAPESPTTPQPPDDGEEETIPEACLEAPAPPPNDLDLDPFYTQYIDVRGIPLIGSSQVVTEAFQPACIILDHMLSVRDDIVFELIDNKVRVAIIAEGELLTELPEYADLDEVFPDPPRPWSELRGLGGTHERPLASTGEENILQLGWPRDKHRGDSILVHEFAHTMFDLGWADVPGEGGDAEDALDSHYEDAMDAGTWDNTYAASNTQEYWAMGVQIWYEGANEAIPSNGIHNHINTRDELWLEDPQLAALVAEVYPDDDFRPLD